MQDIVHRIKLVFTMSELQVAKYILECESGSRFSADDASDDLNIALTVIRNTVKLLKVLGVIEVFGKGRSGCVLKIINKDLADEILKI